MQDILVVFHLSFVSCGESRLIVSRCAGGKCGMMSSDDDLDRSRRPGANDHGWSITDRVLGGQTIMRSGDAVYGLHEERRSAGFLVEP
jgi:hypothetical protein